MDVIQLNTKFGLPGTLEFKTGKGGFIEAIINNIHANAAVSLYGAHIVSYQPKEQAEVLWMSPQSSFEYGKPIRGGIPICFPWFGPHPTDTQKPMHGFGRLNNWEVIHTLDLPSGDTELILQLKSNFETQFLWPYQFTAELKVIIGKKLDITLSYTNNGTETFQVTDALHNYFNISNIEAIDIAGLQNHNYYAGFAKEANNIQSEDLLRIKQEENRRYICHTNECIITDHEWKRKIYVTKRGSKVTVVWNPWEATSKTMGDIPDDGYYSFVCVETANIYDNAITLKPGEDYSIATIIYVEPNKSIT